MKIQNLFFGDNNIRKTGGSKESGRAAEKKSASASSGTVSGSGYVREQVAAGGYTVEPEAAPRMDLVNQVKSQIEGGAFDREYLYAVAERVAESPAVKDVIEETNMTSEDGAVENSGRVEQARSQVDNGYYDDPAVRERIAESLIEALGLDFMAGE